MEVAIIDYGAGNIKSLQFAFQRLGIDAKLTNNWEEIQTADKVIFPGVGEASSAIKMLKKQDLHELIPKLKQPVLGICLGMQLLCNSSEEGNTVGLGVFNTTVKKFNNDLKVPHMGWNTIKKLQSNLFDGVKDSEYMYLVHSFYADKCEETIAITEYGIEYASALKKDNFYGVQFHPEKSSKAGQQILKNFLVI
ncbi:glutamine amidotransferase [Flavobacteriaceae bacterium MAR_2010_188]|nr:glutamine amidotransferase [Flavobacteriaceae bacterium MAR_2010_188]